MAIDIGLILLIATLVTGGIIIYDKLYPKALSNSANNARKQPHLHNELAANSEQSLSQRQPGLLDFSYSFFPILLVIFIVRSFIYEPFRIPSESMQPTLRTGDFILVEKFQYDLRMPGFEQSLWRNNPVKRGDLVVFRYPLNTQEYYIKRVVGLPGEIIEISGQQVNVFAPCQTHQNCLNEQQPKLQNKLIVKNKSASMQLYQETIGSKTYQVLYKAQTQTHQQSEQFQVPANSYFMLGDNRDKSNDSRTWGFVEHQHLVGRALLVWMHIEFEHTDWHWLPTGVRFSDARLLH